MATCFFYVGGCCCLWCIAAITFTVLFAYEMYSYNTELPATCNDVRLVDGSVASRIELDSRRRRSSKNYEYACNIYVDAKTDAGGVIEGKWRSVGNVYSLTTSSSSELFELEIGRTNAEAECQRNARDVSYGCFVADAFDLIDETRTQYPAWQLALMCVSFFFCCIFFGACLVDGNKESLPSTRGLVAKPFQKIANEDDPRSKLMSGPVPSRIGMSDAEKEPSERGVNMGQFRALADEDLCDELIPGLRLRVMFPKVGPVRRWFSAVAVSYDQSARSVTVKFEDDTNVSRVAMVLPCVSKFKIWDNTCRLHESALSQVAKRRILKGLVQTSLFNNITFEKLDLDGNGFLDRTEIQDVLKKNRIILDDSTTNALFERLDVNKDGRINAAEFKDFLTKGDFVF